MILGLSSPLKHSSANEWAKRHRELGAYAINFPVGSHEPHSKIMEYADAAKENGLVIAEVGIWKNVLAIDEKERKEAVDYSISQLQMADEIGAKCCVNIVGTPYGPIWDGGYAKNFSDEAWELAVESIRNIIDKAKPSNTKFSIETMPWMIPSGPDEYLRLLNEVDRKEFGVHLDLINMINCPERYFFNERFMEECFEKLGERIVSCHIKDVRLLTEYTFQLKECACGEGNVNLVKYASLATKYNEKMPMIIEHLNTDEEYLNSLKYLQNLLECKK